MLSEQVLDPAALTAALLSSHMIIYWLSQDSNVTPPVCLTAFAAAAVAGTRPIATGFTAWKIAKGLYIVPLLIAYTPLLGGATFEVLEVFVFGICGIYALNGAIDGYLESPIGWVGRVLLAIAAVALLWPNQTLWHLGGIAVFALMFTLSVRARRRIEAQGGTRS